MTHDPVITLTTDFGYEDPFVGVMKGVIIKINPLARIVDLTHGIKPQDIRGAAYTIGTSYRFFPENTIHLVVVDPGVGSGRRPIVVSTDHHYFIGPDNGIFSLVYRDSPERSEVIHVTSSHYFLSSDSPTFQGRDVFAPIAAWLSRGITLEKLGEPIGDYCKIDLPLPGPGPDGVLIGEVIHIDRFGNAISNITGADLERYFEGPETPRIALFRDMRVPFASFYAQADGGLKSILNSSGYLELFVYSGNASKVFDISVGDKVSVSPLVK